MNFLPSLFQTLICHLLLLTSVFCWSGFVLAEGKPRPDEYAPANVSLAQTYQKNELAFAYRYTNAMMNDSLNSTHHLTETDILAGAPHSGSYLIAPVKMQMDIHNFEAIYAPSDTTSLMISVPFLALEMGHVISPLDTLYPDETFNTESSGLGDVQIFSIWTLEKTEQNTLLMSMGLNLPTGSISETDTLLALPALGDTQLPFPMQLGSGTYDLLPSFTYKSMFEKRSWGGQVSATFRLDENEQGYTLGNRRQIQTWHAWLINHELSFSTRASLSQWDNINGDNRERKVPSELNLNSTIVKTLANIDPRNQGGQRAEIGIGFNGVYGETQHRLGIELMLPVHQKLDGPQLDQDLVFTLVYQKPLR
jgi:hypothetical protein